MRTKKTAILPNLPIEILEARIAPANLAFAISGGGAGNQSIQDVGVDAVGNIYVSGRFQGTVDFDPAADEVESRTALVGDTDAFVAKYTSTGALSWVDIIRASNEDAGEIELAVAENGDVFLSATFGRGQNNTSVSFSDQLGPPALTVNQLGTQNDVYVAKIDTRGNFVWAVPFGKPGTVNLSLTSTDIATDSNGGIYFAGRMSASDPAASIDFGAFTLNVDDGDDDPFVVKLQDGLTPTVVWANDASSPGVTADIQDLDIAADRLGNVAVRGTLTGSMTFDTPAPTPVAQKIFVGKLNTLGAWAWVGAFDGGEDNSANVAFDSAGNVYATGDFTGSIDVDPDETTVTLTSVGLLDSYLLKLNAGGSFESVRQFGNAGDNSAGSVMVDGFDNVHLPVDGSIDPLDVDPGVGVQNLSAEGIIVTLDSTGNFIEAAGGFSTNSDGGDGFAIDRDGGLYRAGAFAGSFNVALSSATKTLKSKGGEDFFVAHYFPGDIVAQDLQQPGLAGAFTLGGAGNEFVQDGKTDADGNIYLTGLFSGTVDFDPDPSPARVTNLTSTDPDGNPYIVKYDSSGALVWARSIQMSLTFDNNADDLALKLGIDDARNVYLAGEFDAAATLGIFTVANSTPTPGAVSSRDVFVAKLDSTGTPIWLKSFGAANQNDFTDSFAVHPTSGDVVLGGDFRGTIDFDPGAAVVSRTSVDTGLAQSDGYIVELDTAGVFQWVRQLGGSAPGPDATVHGLGFAADDIVAVGHFSGTIDFNLFGPASLLTSAGNTDVFVARFNDADGTVVWRKTFGAASEDEARAVVVNAANEIFVTGSFESGVDFDPGPGRTVLVESGGIREGMAMFFC